MCSRGKRGQHPSESKKQSVERGGLKSKGVVSKPAARTGKNKTIGQKNGPKLQAQATQQLVDVEAIRDGVIIVKAAQCARFLCVRPSTSRSNRKTSRTRLSISTRTFLNGLDFSVQFVIHSRKLDISDYISGLKETLKNQDNELLRIQTEEYIDFIQGFVGMQNIMSKTFLVVVPYGTHEDAQTSFTDRFFGKRSFSFVKMSDEEFQKHKNQLWQAWRILLRACAHSAFAPCRSTTPSLSSCSSTSITPGKPANNSFYRKTSTNDLWPYSNNQAWKRIFRRSRPRRDLKTSSLLPRYSSTAVSFSSAINSSARFFLYSYPRYLNTNWFSPVINLDRFFDIGIHFHPVDTAVVMKRLKQKVTSVEAQLSNAKKKGSSATLSFKRRWVTLSLCAIRSSKRRKSSFVSAHTSRSFEDSAEQLDKAENEIKGILDARMVLTKPANFQQEIGFMSTMPLSGKIALRSMPTSTPDPPLRSFRSYPQTSRQTKGILYGINRHNNSLILLTASAWKTPIWWYLRNQDPAKATPQSSRSCAP